MKVTITLEEEELKRIIMMHIGRTNPQATSVAGELDFEGGHDLRGEKIPVRVKYTYEQSSEQPQYP